MGGLLDGSHQIFQFHSMLSAKISSDSLVGVKINMVWDGVFHSLVWVATALGIWLLWRAVTRPGVVLSGKAFVALF